MGFLLESGRLYTSHIPPNRKKSNLHEFLESPMTPIRPCKIAVYNNHPPIFGPHCFQPWLMPDTCLGLALFMCFIVKLWKPSWPVPPSLFKNRGLVVVLYRQMANECFESMVFPAATNVAYVNLLWLLFFKCRAIKLNNFCYENSPQLVIVRIQELIIRR